MPPKGNKYKYPFSIDLKYNGGTTVYMKTRELSTSVPTGTIIYAHENGIVFRSAESASIHHKHESSQIIIDLPLGARSVFQMRAANTLTFDTTYIAEDVYKRARQAYHALKRAWADGRVAINRSK